LSVRIVSPGGDGIAGVDFRIGFTDGSSLAGYTQEDGWSLAAEDRRRAAWIELAVPMHGIASPRFDLDPAKDNLFVFWLVPNDLGQVDFEGEPLDADQDRLVMHRGGADMVFVKSGKAPSPPLP
jgi:hypothetical protein